MLNLKAIVIVAISASVCSCANTADVASYQSQIDSLKQSVADLEQSFNTLADYQRTLSNEVGLLYKESEDAFSALISDVDTLKRTTNGLEFIPGEFGRAIVSSTPGVVVLPLARTAFWKSSGGRNPDAQGNHSYSLYVTEGGEASIELFSSNEPIVDTYLYLLSDRGNVIAQDDNSGELKYSRISGFLKAGKYTVVAATYDEGVNASYVVKVEGVKGRLEAEIPRNL